MTPERIEHITQNFYSQYCCIHLSELEHGNCFVSSEERDEILKGFGCKYTIYILVKDGRYIAAFSPKYKKIFEPWKNYGSEELIGAAGRRFGLKKLRLMIFGQETISDFGCAKILRASDYPLYEAFFREVHPDVDPSGWLEDYFIEKTGKEYFTGYVLNGKLVSVCDAPDMPYLEGKIQHTGVQTLVGERRKGFASRTAALAAHHLLEMDICPQWECSAENLASAALAQSIGYRPFAEAYVLEEYRQPVYAEFICML